jgi:hypothetical protein
MKAAAWNIIAFINEKKGYESDGIIDGRFYIKKRKIGLKS